MAMLFMSGWETGTNLDLWDSYSLANGAVSTTYRRGSHYSMLFSNAGEYSTKSFTAASEIYFQAAIAWTGDDAFNCYGIYFKFLNDSSYPVCIGVDQTGRIYVTTAHNRLLATGITSLDRFRWHVIEARIKPSTTDGIIQIKVNERLEIDYSGSIGSTTAVARYRFESGALTTDSAGSNTLSTIGSPTANTGDYREGSAAADIDTSNGYYIASANQSSDFPLKYNSSNTRLTYTFWFKASATGSWRGLVGNLYSGSPTYRIGPILNVADLRYEWGASEIDTGIDISTGVWYHCAFCADAAYGYAYMRLYNASTGVVSEYVKTDHVAITDYQSTFSIGSMAGTSSYRFVGIIDEVLVFNDILNVATIDSIRNSTYSGITGTGTVDGIQIYSPTNADLYVDDVIVNDTSGDYNNSWPDGAFVISMTPRSDLVTQWTAPLEVEDHWMHTGTNVVTSAYYPGFIYHAGVTPGLIELYGLEETPVELAYVDSIQPVIEGFKSITSPTITALRALITVDGTTFNSSTFDLTIHDAFYVPTIWQYNPVAGTPWTSSDLDSLAIGVESIY